MLTRGQTQQLINHYSLTLPQRVDAALNVAAASGVAGCQISYQNVAPRAIVDAVINRYTAAGWTVVDDNVNFVLTFS